jgi:hypothetical protein
MRSLVISIFAALSLILIAVPKADLASAFAADAVQPFGGPIIVAFPCTCSGPYFFMPYDYKDKITLPLVYIPLISRLNSYYMLYQPIVETLGTYYFSTGECWVTVTGSDCEMIPTIGTVTPEPWSGVGTGGAPNPSVGI